MRLENQKPVGVGRATVVLEMIGMCSTDFNNWHFTAEGKRIAEPPDVAT